MMVELKIASLEGDKLRNKKIKLEDTAYKLTWM
jgi:hypothetical protein